MEETITTTSEESTEQTTPVVEEEKTQPEEQTIEKTETQEPETTETETVIEKPATDWEKIAKDNQASYTRVSQELAQLKKQIEENKPKAVDERGKITAEYEQNYRFELDNREFLTYDNYARQLPVDEREEVESLLLEAKRLYNPNNKTAYNQKMAEVKNHFDSNLVVQIALDRQKLENQMQSEFDRLTNEYKQNKSREIAELVEQSNDLKALLYQESENYSPETFGIIKQMFDLTGGVDLDMTQKAIASIKALGVKEYLASQKVQTEKAKANVPTGETVAKDEGNSITRDYAVKNYQEAVKKYGMEKVDEIIMKG
jgi:hypothetical protein